MLVQSAPLPGSLEGTAANSKLKQHDTFAEKACAASPQALQ
jgi:hypothetical protein